MVDLGLILTGVLFVLVVLGALRGMSNGGRQLVRTGLAAGAAVLAYLITLAAEEFIISAVTPEKLKEYLVGISDKIEAVNIEGVADYLTSLDLVVALPGAFIAPIAFVLIFFALYAAITVASSIICGVLGIRKGGLFGGKILSGTALGAVEGLIVAAVICIPLSGILGLAGDSVDVMREKGEEKYASAISTYDESVAPLNEHFAITTARSFGADAIMESFSTVTIDGNEVNLRDEFINVVSIVVEFTSIGEIDFTALTDDNKAAISSAVDSLEHSDYLMMLASGIVSDLGHALEDNVIPISVPAPYDVVLNPVISMLATSNIDNFKADLDTVLEIYYLLSDSLALKAFGQEGKEQEMTDAFVSTDADGKTVISKVITIIEKNEHMSALIKALTDMSLIMLTNQLGIDADVTEVYDSIKEGVTDVLAVNAADYSTPEEYETARNEKLDETLTENGIELEPEIVDGIGDFIDENREELEDLSDKDLSEIILSYYDVYMENQSQNSENP